MSTRTVSQALGHKLRMAALDRALAAADRRFGALDAALVLRAEAELSRDAKKGGPRRRRRR